MHTVLTCFITWLKVLLKVLVLIIAVLFTSIVNNPDCNLATVTFVKINPSISVRLQDFVFLVLLNFFEILVTRFLKLILQNIDLSKLLSLKILRGFVLRRKICTRKWQRVLDYNIKIPKDDIYFRLLCKRTHAVISSCEAAKIFVFHFGFGHSKTTALFTLFTRKKPE